MTLIIVEYPKGRFGLKIFSIKIERINKKLTTVKKRPIIENMWIGTVEKLVVRLA
tara:strand:+ start:1290 stop:1454 length:165 start_codon:yes stop_codon:yes gene_type:complete